MARRTRTLTLAALSAGLAVVAQGTASAGTSDPIRIEGATRYDTAAMVAAEGYPAKTGGTVYVVSGVHYAYALPVGPAAGDDDAPILQTSTRYLPAATKTALRSLRPSKVVVVGGSGTVAPNVVSDIKSITGTTVVRIAGRDRYDNAVRLSRTVKPPRTVFLASGYSQADALSAGVAATHLNSVVLLTNPKTLPSTTRAELRRVNPAEVIVVGGPRAVTDTVVNQVTASLPSSTKVRRVYGTHSADTAVAVAKYAWPDGNGAVSVASTRTHGDALIASSVSATGGMPLLWTSPTCIPKPTLDAVNRMGASRTVVLGGPLSSYWGAKTC